MIQTVVQRNTLAKLCPTIEPISRGCNWNCI